MNLATINDESFLTHLLISDGIKLFLYMHIWASKAQQHHFFFSLSPSSCYQHLSLDSEAEVCDKNNLNPTVEIESYFLVPRIHFSEVYCEHRDPDEYRASPELNTATGTGTWSASLMNLLCHM